MLSAFGIVASCNVLFVAWRVWVAQRYPRDAAPRDATDNVPAAHVTTTS